MRLDLFLKASRLAAGRGIAQKLCDAGVVLINNKKAKSAHPVKAGEELALQLRSRLLVVQIVTVPTNPNTPRKEAAALYNVIKDERLPDDE